MQRMENIIAKMEEFLVKMEEIIVWIFAVALLQQLLGYDAGEISVLLLPPGPP